MNVIIIPLFLAPFAVVMGLCACGSYAAYRAALLVSVIASCKKVYKCIARV